MHDNSIKLLHEKADLLVENGQVPEACAVYEQLCELDPTDVDAWCMWGILCIEIGQLDSAAEKLQKALAQDPAHSMANYGLSSIHAHLDRLDDAHNCCQQAIAHDPEFAEAWLLLSRLQARNACFSDSETSSRTAVSLMPESAEAHLQLAVALKAQNRMAAAIESLVSALQIEPDLAYAHQTLGEIFKANGDFMRAAEHLNRALQAAPDNLTAYDELASIYLTQGRPDSAEALMRSAVELMPNHPVAHNSLGFVLHGQGRYQEASQSFHEAARLDPSYVAPIRNLATISWLLGRPDEALAYSLKLVQIEPDVLQNRQNLLRSLRAAMPETAGDDLLNQIEQCFGVPGLDLQEMVKPVIKLLMSRSDFRNLALLVQHGEPSEVDHANVTGGFETVFANKLFRLLLTFTLSTAIEVESLMSGLRKILLRAVCSDQYSTALAGNLLGFAIALACQFFNNEYVCLQDSEETRLMDELAERLKNSLNDDIHHRTVQFELGLAVFAMYGPLYRYAWLKPLAEREPLWLSGEFHPILKRQWHDHYTESSIRSDIVVITEIDDATSRAVRMQYEESPYPRWLSVGLYSPRPYQDVLRGYFATYKPPDMSSQPVRVLNAGCGTGRHAIMSATRYADSEVLAVDLSLSSLAYARRSAEELGITNISFRQADILKLATLDERFHLIECGGVLHHIENTAAALKVLVDLLYPGGVIMLGLYSEIARSNVAKCVDFIQKSGFRKTVDDVRKARRAIMSLDDSRDERRVVQSPDFYSLSSCRDLLFHEHEHVYRLPAIAGLLNACSLRFLGFESIEPRVMNGYRAEFPHDPDCADLYNWDLFEQQHPRTFAVMYNMWCQKTDI